MSRITVDIDDRACAEVMRRYGLATKREAINYALRTLAAEPPLSLNEARTLQGIGWEGDLDAMRALRHSGVCRNLEPVGDTEMNICASTEEEN